MHKDGVSSVRQLDSVWRVSVWYRAAARRYMRHPAQCTRTPGIFRKVDISRLLLVMSLVLKNQFSKKILNAPHKGAFRTPDACLKLFTFYDMSVSSQCFSSPFDGCGISWRARSVDATTAGRT